MKPAGGLSALAPELLAQIDVALEQLLDLSPREREVALAAQPAALQPLLRAMLDEAAGMAPSDAGLPAPLRLLQALADSGADSTAGRVRVSRPMTGEQDVVRVGDWVLLHELGRGGMGSVHLGERRRAGLVQRAAIKRLHAGIDSQDFLRRFERERRILSELSHPGIARLIDAGEDADGRPYLVMDLVEGQPIDRYCDEAQLSLDARIELFLQALDALDHAHRRGVLHRDIKPSNLLVDDAGRSHLLDFGIAKPLQAASSDELATATGLRLLTPHYASPEQLMGQQMGVAADLYQAGLLLYQLLTGCRAQEPADPSPAALQRAVCEQPPLPPSQRFGDADAEARATTRCASPRSLARRLRGDLDRIVLMCLRKEPEARYTDVAGLAEDLRRWQRGLPVKARGPSVLYRTRRLLSRHPLESAAALLLGAVLVLYAVQQREQARALAAERDAAAAQALRAERTKSMLLQLFAQADPERSGVSDLSVRELLARGLTPLEEQLEDDPALAFDLRLTVADAQLSLGLPAEARAEIEAAALAMPEPSRDPVQRQRWWLLAGRAAAEQGDYAAARALLDRASRAGAPGSEAVHARWEARKAQGWVELWDGRIEAADALFSALQAEVEAHQGAERQLAGVLNSLGSARRAAGRLDSAAELLQRATALSARVWPVGHPERIHILNNLAVLHRSRGDEAAAEALYREVLGNSREKLGTTHPGTATIMNNLARLLKSQGRLDESLELLQQALEVRRHRLGERHPLVAMTLSDIGWVEHDRGDLDAAERHYREALSLYPPGHAWRGATVFNLGRLAEVRGQLGEAEALYRQALEDQQRQYGMRHERVGIDHLHLGIVLRKQKRLDEAGEQLVLAEQAFAQALPPSHDRFAQLWIAQADLAEARGDVTLGRTLLQRALQQREQHLATDDPRAIALRRRLLDAP